MTGNRDSGLTDAMSAARSKAATEAVPATKEERAVEVERLIESLRRKLPARQFGALEKILSDESEGIALGVPGDPDGTYLVARIYVLRDADRAERQQVNMVIAASEHEAPLKIVVTESTAGEKILARLRRSTRGENTLVLSDQDLNVENLLAAVSALAMSRRQHGEIPSATITLNLRRQGMPRGTQGIHETRSWATDVISRLRESQRKSLSGLGNGRELMTTVKPVKGSP